MASHGAVVASIVSEFVGHEEKIAELEESMRCLMMEVCRLRNRLSWQDFDHRICMYETRQQYEEQLIDAFMTSGKSLLKTTV